MAFLAEVGFSIPRSLPRAVKFFVRAARRGRWSLILFGLLCSGVIAYEAAQHWRQAGVKSTVVMADTWAPGYIKRLPFLAVLFNFSTT